MLLAGESVTHRSENFDLKDCNLFPRSGHRARPTIYVGGESTPARDLVADHGDVWFINGQPLEDVAALIADVQRRPRRGPPLRFGLSAFVIARETSAEANERRRSICSRSPPRTRRCGRCSGRTPTPRW